LRKIGFYQVSARNSRIPNRVASGGCPPEATRSRVSELLFITAVYLYYPPYWAEEGLSYKVSHIAVVRIGDYHAGVADIQSRSRTLKIQTIDKHS
jgi:hypothetical protein